MMLLAIACLSLVLPARAAAIAPADITALAQKLKSTDPFDRRQAVVDLAKDASPAAWPLVIDALRDPDPMVADEAQIQLGTLADASIAKTLFAKDGLSSNDPWVRARVAEALGRMKVEIDAAALCKRMSDKDVELRRLAAWSIERLARADHIESKSKRYAKQELDNVVKKDADPSVRAAALCARHALEPLSVSYLFEILSAKETGIVRSAATHLMADVELSQIAGLVGASLMSEDVCVRQAYVRELARDGSRGSVHALVSVLQYEKNPRVSWTIVEYLQALTGQKLKLEPLKWLEWEMLLMENWQPSGSPFGKGAKDKKYEYDTVASAFMDMPLLSNRIALLFDFSESMWSKQPNGKTRKDTIEFELRHWLEHLPAGTEFNVIPYADAPVPWEKGLQPATPANIKRALTFFKDCKANGKGNFWDAASLALSDSKVDTILLVSSGEPNGGHHWNLALIKNLLAERNRFRHVVFDALILGGKPEVQELWQEICAQNGGRMRPVEMK